MSNKTPKYSITTYLTKSSSLSQISFKLLCFSAYYGRKPEISILMNSLHSVVNYRLPIMAVVRGHGGMGKSYLVKTLENENVYFIIAKFDINGCRPDSVLFEALDLFFGKLTDADNDISKSQMIQRIHEMVGCGIA